MYWGFTEHIPQTVFILNLKKNVAEIDLDKFISYLTRFPVVSVRKRAGFFLEQIGSA